MGDRERCDKIEERDVTKQNTPSFEDRALIDLKTLATFQENQQSLDDERTELNQQPTEGV